MNVQCINIGAAIYQILTSDTAVTNLVGSRIYPLVAPEGTQFPYIVYSCMSMTSAADKDCFFYQQDVLEGIVVCTDTYKEGIDIAMAVTEAMQFHDRVLTLDEGVIEIMESALDTRTEDYVNNTFVQGTTFHLKIR